MPSVAASSLCAEVFPLSWIVEPLKKSTRIKRALNIHCFMPLTCRISPEILRDDPHAGLARGNFYRALKISIIVGPLAITNHPDGLSAI